MSNIRERIDAQWERYIRLTGENPKFVFLGYDDLDELDKTLGQVTVKYRDMYIIMAQINRHVSVGNRYSEKPKGEV